jgi:23S rRNA pseudouridine2605 synthase
VARVRLQKLIASAGLTSRRKAEEWILEGRVRVNGETCRKLGTTVDPDADEVRVGRRVVRPAPRKTVVLHKPAGCLTTMSDPHGRPTVVDLLPKPLRNSRLVPVGRLDMDTTGVLILTNDGDLAQAIAHPRSGCEKEYKVRVKWRVTPATIQRIRRGIPLEGRRTAPCRARILRKGRDVTDISVVIREGRHHQVKRMMVAVGHPPLRLKRTRVGPVTLDRLRLGACRELRRRELDQLRRSAAVSR